MLFLFDSHFREFLFKLNICAIDIVQSKLQVAKSVAILHVLILKTSTSHLQLSLKRRINLCTQHCSVPINRRPIQHNLVNLHIFLKDEQESTSEQKQ